MMNYQWKMRKIFMNHYSMFSKHTLKCNLKLVIQIWVRCYQITNIKKPKWTHLNNKYLPNNSR